MGAALAACRPTLSYMSSASSLDSSQGSMGVPSGKKLASGPACLRFVSAFSINAICAQPKVPRVNSATYLLRQQSSHVTFSWWQVLHMQCRVWVSGSGTTLDRLLHSQMVE